MTVWTDFGASCARNFPDNRSASLPTTVQIFLRGTVKDLTSSARAIQIASTAGKVMNLLYVDVPASEPQILLKVRFASVDRTQEKQLGLNDLSLGAANSIGGTTTGQFPGPSFTPFTTNGSSAAASLSDFMNLFIFRPDLNLGATLQALETKGVLEVLAEPNVLAINGKQASFLAGGEYPYPTVQGVTGGGGTGAITIQFKEFGVRLNFIPTITPRNTIHLQVSPEVSSLDFTNGINISGFTVPGLTVRRVKTDIELREGQSFAIGGLLDNRETETFSKIPFIGDVPILGKLFQSIQRTKSNTELLVIVTPEIVAPIPAGSSVASASLSGSVHGIEFKHPMSNPGPSVTGAKPLAEATPTMPVEKLIDSMKPEQPLVIEGGMIPAAATQPVGICGGSCIRAAVDIFGIGVSAERLPGVALLKEKPHGGIAPAYAYRNVFTAPHTDCSATTMNISRWLRKLGLTRDHGEQRTDSASGVRFAILGHKDSVAWVEVADRGPARTRGLLGRQSLAEGEGLWIVPCEAVHTFGMQFAIDLVFLDRRNVVRKVRSSVPPWRLSGCLRARSVSSSPQEHSKERQSAR